MGRVARPTNLVGCFAQRSEMWLLSTSQMKSVSSGFAQYENMTGTVDNTCVS